MQPDRNKTRTVEGEAQRGADNARAFLAKKPSQAALWRAIQWSYDAYDDDPASRAYDRAWRAILEPHLTDPATTRQEVEQEDAEALERALAELNESNR